MSKIADLEQEIMQCWNLVDDLSLINDNPNLLQHLAAVYEAKFSKMFKTFEEVCREYHSKNKTPTVTFNVE